MTNLHGRLLEELSRLFEAGELPLVVRLELSLETITALLKEASTERGHRGWWRWEGKTDPLDPWGYTLAGIPLAEAKALPPGIFVFAFKTQGA